MNRDRRKLLEYPDICFPLSKLVQVWVDHVIGSPEAEAPAMYFKYVDDLFVDAIEEALLKVEIPTSAEWADGSDEAADREREESLGL